MGRTDAWALQLPEPLPIMPEAVDTTPTPDAPSASSQITQMLQAVQTRAAAPKSQITSCPKCKAMLSAVEQKFEKCLGCGTSFAASDGGSNVSVGI